MMIYILSVSVYYVIVGDVAGTHLFISNGGCRYKLIAFER